jgi:hypothetical protein
MMYLVSMIAGGWMCVLLVLYSLWDTLVVLLFGIRAVIELATLVVAILLAATDVSLRQLSNNHDTTLWGVAKWEFRKTGILLKRDLLATLMTPRLLQEIKQ